MATEETTQRTGGSDSTDKLNASLNESVFSSQKMGNSSIVGGATDTPSFIIIFRSITIVLGVVGFITNGFVLRVLLSRKHPNNTSYTFLTNQMIMDTASSFLLIVVYAYKVSAENFYYAGPSGFALCILFRSDVLVFTVQVGSIASLVLIAAERYFKIVLPVLHKLYYRDWMTVVGILFTWTNGIFLNISILWTTRLVNGACLFHWFWPTRTSSKQFTLFLVTWQFVLPLLLFVFFYGSILYVVRKRSRVFQGNCDEGDMSTALQRNARRSQMNIVVTMFAVSASFVVSWFPNQFYVIFNQVGVLPYSGVFYSSSMLFIFLNTCVNPLIYASKHEFVRKNLRRMFSKKPLNVSAINNTTQVVSSVA